MVFKARRLSGIGSSVGILSKLKGAGLAIFQQSTSNAQIVADCLSCEGLNWKKKGGNRPFGRFSPIFLVFEVL